MIVCAEMDEQWGYVGAKSRQRWLFYAYDRIRRTVVAHVFGEDVYKRQEERGRGITEGFVQEQFRQFGITSPLSPHFVNSELRYSYGAPEGLSLIHI